MPASDVCPGVVFGVYSELLHSCSGDRRVCGLVARTLIGASSGAMRLAHRALEMHAVNVGYRTGSGCSARSMAPAMCCAGASPMMWACPVALKEARLATLALTRATASTAGEPMLVPGQIADGLGHLLAIDLIGAEVVAGA